MGETIRGYKVFAPDWTCRNYQYSCPGVFEMDEEPMICERGFHFCRKIFDCFSYYEFNPKNKVAEVEALGQTKFDAFNSKCCTNKISIVRELPWKEVVDLSNIGATCCGFGNSGNYNEGNFNAGDSNVGSSNAGDLNSGFGNSGSQNIGNRNAGSRNLGNFNTGNYNIGDFNVGDYNTGDFNTGDWNVTSRCSGCFMTEKQPFFMFNKPTDMVYSQWENSRAAQILGKLFSSPVDNQILDNTNMMNGESLCSHSEITGVNLIKVDPKENVQEKWDDLDEKDKQCVMDLPNFDKDIFYKCTGIKID